MKAELPTCPKCQIDHPALVKAARDEAVASYGQVAYEEYERLRDHAIALGHAAREKSSVVRELGRPGVMHHRFVCVNCGHHFVRASGNYVEGSLITQVVKFIDQGRSLREICRALPVSKKTVQRYRMMRQTGEDSTTPLHNLNDVSRPISLDALKGIVLEPKRDEQFYPLLLYKGSQTMGRAQSLWNYVRALMQMETPNLSEAVKFGGKSPDARHLLGLHAAPQGMSLRGFMSRLWFTPEVRDMEPHLRDYMAWFAGGNPDRFYWHYTKVPRYATWRTNRPWRVMPPDMRAKVRGEFGLRKSQGRAIPTTWPFISGDVSGDHSLLMQIDRCVPKYLHEQIRQDVCQDLVVAVLSGDLALGDLQGAIKKHVGHVFKMHPMKYGPLSLDAPAPWQTDDVRPLSRLLVAE